jgi:hypothetical protein
MIVYSWVMQTAGRASERIRKHYFPRKVDHSIASIDARRILALEQVPSSEKLRVDGSDQRLP